MGGCGCNSGNSVPELFSQLGGWRIGSTAKRRRRRSTKTAKRGGGRRRKTSIKHTRKHTRKCGCVKGCKCRCCRPRKTKTHRRRR